MTPMNVTAKHKILQYRVTKEHGSIDHLMHGKTNSEELELLSWSMNKIYIIRTAYSGHAVE